MSRGRGQEPHLIRRRPATAVLPDARGRTAPAVRQEAELCRDRFVGARFLHGPDEDLLAPYSIACEQIELDRLLQSKDRGTIFIYGSPYAFTLSASPGCTLAVIGSATVDIPDNLRVERPLLIGDTADVRIDCPMLSRLKVYDSAGLSLGGRMTGKVDAFDQSTVHSISSRAAVTLKDDATLRGLSAMSVIAYDRSVVDLGSGQAWTVGLCDTAELRSIGNSREITVYGTEALISDHVDGELPLQTNNRYLSVAQYRRLSKKGEL